MTKAKMGRPTKLTPEILEKVDEYLAGAYTVFPSIIGLASYIGVVSNTLRNWAEKDKDFLNTLEEVEEQSQIILLEGGLKKEFDSGLTKFTLSARHAYREKSDVTTDGKEISAFGLGHKELNND